jgi:hypothetical protein
MQWPAIFVNKGGEMSMFREWLKRKGLLEDFDDSRDPTSDFTFNTDDTDFANDYDQTLTDLIKIVLRKYPDETIDFLSTIASRGDAEVAALLKKVSRGQENRSSVVPKHPKDQDEVMPSIADVGHTPEE